MSTVRTVFLCAALVFVALLSPSRGQAAICGFPGFVLVGAVGGGFAWVSLFSVVPPFPAAGIASTPLAGPIGPACLNLWTMATLGPPPPNFLAVWGAAPAGCAGACSATPLACSATLCAAFP
jgi:hypothetical protein